MKIGLLFAMPSEFRTLPGAKDLSPIETVSGIPFYEVSPGIMACAGGVGKVNAAMAAEILCLKYGADLILNAGVVGCTSDLPIGTLVIASDCVQHDMDTTAVGTPAGFVSTVDRAVFSTWEPARCTEILVSAGFPAVTGRVATGDWFAVNSPRAERLQETFSPLLVDMEACAIAQVCLRNGVKFVALKSVSDHIFGEAQSAECADLRWALAPLGAAVLSLAEALRDMA